MKRKSERRSESSKRLCASLKEETKSDIYIHITGKQTTDGSKTPVLWCKSCQRFIASDWQLTYRFHAFFYHTTMVLMWNWRHEFCLLISNYTPCCKLKCNINCMCMHYMNLNTQLLFVVAAARFASCESPKWFWTVDQNLTSPQTDVLLVGRHFSPSNGFGSVPIWFENSLLFDLNSERRDLAWLTCRRCSCSLSVGRKGADFKPLWTLFALLERVRWSEAWRVVLSFIVF